MSRLNPCPEIVNFFFRLCPRFRHVQNLSKLCPTTLMSIYLIEHLAQWVPKLGPYQHHLGLKGALAPVWSSTHFESLLTDSLKGKLRRLSHCPAFFVLCFMSYVNWRSWNLALWIPKFPKFNLRWASQKAFKVCWASGHELSMYRLWTKLGHRRLICQILDRCWTWTSLGQNVHHQCQLSQTPLVCGHILDRLCM